MIYALLSVAPDRQGDANIDFQTKSVHTGAEEPTARTESVLLGGAKTVGHKTAQLATRDPCCGP